ncbi:acid protease [Cristinia sonorae]|uniref:Acid protease n=1 Tax=Cristinia sonorae TaxID=1940300 RepID=A0A8K0XPJ6_9AGAR|nr:acid protease [Cristinia sonorae]
MSTSLPFISRVVGNHARDILALDRSRAQKVLAGINPHGPTRFAALGRGGRHGGGGGGTTKPPASDSTGVDVTDAGVTYTTSVGVGSPPFQYTLLIDTGSSNTWLGAQKKYVKTSTSHSTGNRVNVSYGSGQFSGTEYTDTVTLAPALVIEGQSIGVSSSAQGFDDVDGIIGIGPVDLTSGTVSNTDQVPTVVDNLFAQGTISQASIGIFYQPTTSDNQVNGELNFGGVDDSKITGDVNFVPITSTSPASHYWGIDQSISYGDSEVILNTTAGIVDTGTTLLLLATDAFQAYQRATGAKEDRETGLLTITEQQFDRLQSLFFNIGGVTYELTANAQIWPRSLNSTIGGEEGKIYLITADLGSPSGQGLDFIDGFGFLQRFYSVYDTGNSQVGLATTPFTDAETN